MVKGACCVAASVLLFLPLALWLYSSRGIAPAERASLAARFVMPEYCNPQPGERAAYLAGVVFLPASLFGLAFACRRWETRLPPLPGLRRGLGLALAAALGGVAWLALLGDDFFHLRRNLFFLYPLLAVPLVPAALLALRWDVGGRRFVRPVLHLAAAALAGVVFAASVFDDKGAYCGNFDFTAVFFPVVQVSLGKAVLIDCASQYGLYPHLLQPLFGATGLSVLGFTAVMGLLTAGSYLALWSFLARATENRTAAFLGFAALLFNGWFSFVRCSHFDLYFQYYPIRFVFPALLAPLAWRYLRRPSRLLYWGLFVFLSVGVLWNLDSGLPALLSWAAALCFTECFADGWRVRVRRTAGHLASAAAVLAAVVAAFSVVIRLRYGAFPHYGRFLTYQQLYFGAGYYKHPLSLPGVWLLAALVYLAGFAYAAFALAARRGTPRVHMVFLLSVLGVGLSSYFEGQSNPIVLWLVGWPCLLLLTLFLDELAPRLRERPVRVAPWAAAAGLVWVTTGSACSLVPELGFVGGAVAANLTAMGAPTARPPHGEEAELLRREVPPGEKVLVASPGSAAIHLASGRAAANPASVYQMVRMDEFHALEGALAESPSTKVLVDKSAFSLESWQARSRGLRTLVELLRERYEATADVEHSLLFTRRADGEGLLAEDAACRFHVGIRDGALGRGMTFAPCPVGSPWSLEVVVRPEAEQAPYAALVGNHPGRGTGGFVLHCESPETCALLVGDGRAWRRVVSFGVGPGEWHHLAVVLTAGGATAYVDGAPAAREEAAAPVEESPLPLEVGNWVGGDRPYHGLIREVRILGRALSADEIAESAKRIRARLP